MENLKREIIRLITEENPGFNPDEADYEAESILYRKDLYEQAKQNLSSN